MKNGDKNEKEDEPSPALAVAASLNSGGAQTYLRAEQSSGPWTACNVAIEKIKLVQ